MVKITEKDIDMVERVNPLTNRDLIPQTFDSMMIHIDEKKNTGYKGVLNIDKYDRPYFDLAVKYRNDFKCVNTGQYQIIYDDNQTTNNGTVKVENEIDYPVKFQLPFYLDNENFFNEEDEDVEEFLTESEKVGLSSNMALVPFYCKDSYCYLTIDNLTEEITLDIVNTAFKHINKQSNLYYQIRQAITKELRNNYDEFEHHLLADIRKATGINKRMLNNTFKDPNKLINSNYLHIIKKEQQIES